MPILAFRNIDPDAQVRFQTYRNYLVNLKNFTWAEYGIRAAAYKPLTSAQQSARGFQRVQRRKLTRPQSESVQRSLRMAWANETSLRLRGRQPLDVLHVLLHLALPEAYYSIYHAAQAFMTASGMDVPMEHMSSMNVLSSEIEKRGTFPHPWDIVCVGDASPAAHRCTFLGLPLGTTLAPINQLATPEPGRFYDLHATCLKSTRESFVIKAGLEHKRRTRTRRLPNSFAANLYRSHPPTSLFHFLYRLRLRSNYRDADAFLQGVWTPNEASEFFFSLLDIVGASLLLLENLVVARSGPEPLTSTVRAFGLADTSNVERDELDQRHPGIILDSL